MLQNKACNSRASSSTALLPSASQSHHEEEPIYAYQLKTIPGNARLGSHEAHITSNELPDQEYRSPPPDPNVHIALEPVEVDGRNLLSRMPDLPPPISTGFGTTPGPLAEHQTLDSPFTPVRQSASRNSYQDLLNRIEDHQDELQDARESMIGVRFRLRKRRQELRTTRAQAATQAGVAFDRVKRYLLERGLDLPQDVQYAIEDADIWRDRLGEQEVEFEQAEEHYNLEEWKYTEREKQFVEDMFAATPLASTLLAPASADVDTRGLIEGSSDLLELQYIPALPELDELPANVLDLHQLTAQEQCTAQTDTLLASFDFVSIQRCAPMSLSLSAVPTKNEEVIQTLTRPYSETDLTQVRLNWADTRSRIEDWLLDALEHSHLQKAQLRSQLSSEMGDNEWWQLVLQHWKSDSPGRTAFHTGDTTAPRTSVSQAASATLNMLLEAVVVDDVHTKALTTSPLISLDEIVDALEDVDFPLQIKPSDLMEPGPKHVTFDARSPSVHSLSTEPTTVTRTSSGLDVSSASSVEGGWSRVSSVNADTVRQEPRTDNDQTASPQNLGSHEFSENSHSSPRDAIFAVETVKPMTRVQSTTRAPVTTSSQDFLFVNRKTVQPYPLQVKKSSEQPHGLSDTPRPGSLDHSKTASSIGEIDLPASRSDITKTVAPYIRVQSPEPWSLPLLRLTPRSSHSSVDLTQDERTSHLENIPFVSLSDNPFRLPGPSRLPELFSANLTC
ncbi:hypothetical protein EK21DRAFT_111424 [Setomelanomma holmii]|uniref:Uncharacterized protein n=1 Tax=Setomelanomma holmii TaxID=210430 RepID=A0A9P4LN87_9PLEO|nr:hypothetical protein EK21DRAFT_111424 [Setomelanomma holmii]